MDQVVGQGTSVLLSQGLLGVICLFLVWYIQRQEKRNDDAVGNLKKDWATERKELRDELAAERRLSAELQNDRLDEQKNVLVAMTANTQAMTTLGQALERRAQ